MKTNFTSRDAARWKKIAAICFEDETKREKLQKKIAELQAELDIVNSRIEMNQATVKLDTGYTTNDLVTRIVETSSKVDKNGYPIKSVKWVLNYPDTFIPPKGSDPADFIAGEEPATNEVFDPTYPTCHE